MLLVLDLGRRLDATREAANVIVKVAVVVNVRNKIAKAALHRDAVFVVQWADCETVAEKELLIECR